MCFSLFLSLSLYWSCDPSTKWSVWEIWPPMPDASTLSSLINHSLKSYDVIVVAANHYKSLRLQKWQIFFWKQNWTSWPMDRPTDRQTDGQTDGRTQSLKEMRSRIKKLIQILFFDAFSHLHRTVFLSINFILPSIGPFIRPSISLSIFPSFTHKLNFQEMGYLR